MVSKILNLIKKYREIIAYLVFGVLTTLVNYVFYLPCYNMFGFSAALSNVIAWVAAVAFAFLTNKPFVFKSDDWSTGVVFSELTRFIGCRIGSGGVETLMLLILVDCLGWNGNVWKLLASIIVVILNYIGSKLFVFKK